MQDNRCSASASVTPGGVMKRCEEPAGHTGLHAWEEDRGDGRWLVAVWGENERVIVIEN